MTKFILLFKGVAGNVSLKSIIKNKKYGYSCFTKDINTAKNYAIEYAKSLNLTAYLYTVKINSKSLEYSHGPDEYVFIGKVKDIKIISKKIIK